MTSLAQSRPTAGVYIHDLGAMPWTDAGKDGIRQKLVRRDDAAGTYLGMISFEPETRSGLHQHLGTATTFVMDGWLLDYGAGAKTGQLGVNLTGATHDAVSYGRCLMFARLENRTVYPPDQGDLHGLHAGAAHAEDIRNPFPERMPELVVTVSDCDAVPTSVAGVRRRLIFDYAPAEEDFRLSELLILPETVLPPFTVQGLTEVMVVAGDVSVNGQRAVTNSIITLEPHTRVEWRSTYGALLWCWAEAPIRWDDKKSPDLFGF